MSNSIHNFACIHSVEINDTVHSEFNVHHVGLWISVLMGFDVIFFKLIFTHWSKNKQNYKRTKEAKSLRPNLIISKKKLPAATRMKYNAESRIC